MSTYTHPQQSNVLGQPNIDSTQLPEFTFHHGHVEKVICTAEDLATFGYPVYGAPSDVSQCILLRSTYGKDVTLPSNYMKRLLLAQPLLRGFADSMSRGDSVIYTQIGRIFFYLGPLNTTNNPNYTPDHLYNPNLNPNRVVYDDRKDDESGYNVNFIRKAVNRVTKIRNILLDMPYDIGVGEVGSDAETESNYSDLQLEGRHGNSIQIGTRFVNPYITINNNRADGNNGSVLGMLSFGQISDYFSDFTQLSSDKVVKKEGYIGFPIGIGNDSIDNENEFNISFGAVKGDPEEQTEFDQLIMFSDRITFDAQKNDFTVSALRNINFGAGKNFTLTNKGYSVFESKNIYIGKGAKQRSQPMVLGDKLGEFLAVITSILQDAHALVQGVPVPLVDAGSIPLTTRINEVMRELSDEYNPQYDTENGIPLSDRSIGGPRFYSRHHFIETNRS